LRKLDDESAYANPETVARLEQSVTDSIKRFEYTLRRRLDANASQVFLSAPTTCRSSTASWSSSTKKNYKNLNKILNYIKKI